jgi:hypothetical protein
MVEMTVDWLGFYLVVLMDLKLELELEKISVAAMVSKTVNDSVA